MTPPVTQASNDYAGQLFRDLGLPDPEPSDPNAALWLQTASFAFAKAIAEETARASRLLNDRAAVLRTREGRAKAEWHEEDALMVANELDRQATAIRATVGEVGNG